MSMDLPSVLSEQLLVHEGGDLASRTTLGVGGPAAFIVEPQNRQELLLAVRELSAAGLPFRMLGHGSNLLVSDEGVPEVVLHTRLCQAIYHHEEQQHALRCEAGAALPRLVSLAHEQGLSGVEMLIGIPGTVGGAVAGNSGGHAGAIADRLVEVTLVDPDGSTRAVPCRPEDFGYRRSPFAGQVVLDAVLQLEPHPRPAIMDRMTEILREKARSQPLSAASSGCIFKNPGQDSAGRLIDAAGCKDMAVGAARVSERHANFLVNGGSACAAELMQLIERVRRRVADSEGVELELEVEAWGRFPKNS
jgi:UDP-N-acetylmuramate dehydrogenase